MSEDIFQSEIRMTLSLSYPKASVQCTSARKKSGETCILDIGEFHKDRGGVGFEVDEFDGAVSHDREDTITG